MNTSRETTALARKGAHGLPSRVLAALLSCTLVLSGVPTEALAEMAGATGADAATEAVEVAPVEAAGEATEAAEAVPVTGGQGAADDGVAAAEAADDAATSGTGATDDGTPGAAPTSGTSAGDGANATAAAKPGPRRAAAAKTPTAVQMQRDGTEVTSSTTVNVGDTLTAVPGTEEEDEWGWDTEFTALDDTSGCSYQWYRGTSKSYSSYASSYSSYTAIDGATGQAYTASDGDAGCYLAVKVTCGSSTIWPGNSTDVVRAAGAVDIASVELTGTASIGSTLTAKAWTGSSWDKQEVPAGTKVTYTWRTSDTKPTYSSQNWVTVEDVTGSTLTLTEEYKGKWISVRASAGGKAAEVSYYNALGPVLGEGEAELYSVKIDNTTPSVGDTLTATAYKTYSSSSAVDETTKVTYTWYAGGEQVQSGEDRTLVLTDAMAGKAVKVEATAGVNTVTSSATDAVLARGAVKLYSVEVEGPTSTTIGDEGATVAAHAYKGSYSSKVEVTEGVTFQWRYRIGTSGSWTDIEGASGATYKVPETFPDGTSANNAYLSVTANAKANTVTLSSYTTVGPFKLEGAVDIYSAYLTTEQDSMSGTAKYTAAQTLWAQAKETSRATTNIDPSYLTYQWQASDDNRTWADVAGATSQSLALADYAGRYVRCVVTARVGGATYTTTSRNAVAGTDALDVQKVSLDNTSPLVGDTVTATATGAGGTDVTNDGRVAWQWYWSSTANGTETPIEGATTNTLTVTSDLLGRYVRAHADGSDGAWADMTSSAAGPVKVPGAVRLDHVTLSGDAKVGSTLTATAYTGSYTKADSSAKVTYQFQYATSKSTSDADFTDIEGARVDGGATATWTIPESFTDASGQTVTLGNKYIRVKAMSDNSVVSTKASYWNPTYPLGPVTVEGGYDLTGVRLSSNKTNAQVGATLSAVARYERQGSYSSYETDVPSDAQVTYTWYMADDAAGTNKAVLKTTVTEKGKGSEPSTFELTEAVQGKYVWVEAQAKMTPATSDRLAVVPTGSYELHQVYLSPSSTDTVLTGDEVKATVYASQLGTNYGKDVTGADGIAVQWYVADSASTADADWVPLEGATSATLTVPEEAAGKYLRAVATSGTSSAKAAYENAVVGRDSLEGAKALLEGDYGWRPTLTYGEDENINQKLLDDLEARGFDTTGLTARVKSVSLSSASSDATVGISTDDADNGTISYFDIDPTKTTSWSITALHTVRSITFELSRDGETVEYTPSKTFSIPWDEDKLEARLQAEADRIAIGYATGDSAESVTGTLTLPYKAGEGDAATWTSVAWDTSSDDTVAVTGSGYRDYAGTVTRHASDRGVTLTATVSGLANYDMPADVTASKTFDVTVKGDPEKVASETAELASKLENGFSYKTVTDFATKGAVDHTAVAADLQMPTTRTLGVDGKYYAVEFSSTGDAVSFNGYHGIVVRPFGADATATITCTITDKANPEISASKSLDFTVKAASEDDIDAELALLDEVEAGYKAALLDGQSEPAASNLATFQKAYRAADGTVSYARSRAEADAHYGIVPVELPGYDAMGSYDQARTFRSSKTAVVLNETLQLAWNADQSTSLSQYHDQPAFNTSVTVSSRLASERYGGYYARYKDDPTVSDALKAKLARLAGEDVSAGIVVAGSTGQDAQTPEVTLQVVGLDDFGAADSWLAQTGYAVEAGSTADDLARTALGARYTAAGITSPTGTLLADGDAGTWTATVNGSTVGGGLAGLAGVVLGNGDDVVLRYVVPQGTQVRVSVKVTGPDGEGGSTTWVPLAEVSVPEGSTAAQATKTALERYGMTSTDGTYTIEATGDGTLPNGQASLGSGDTTYWKFYVNGAYSRLESANYVVQPGDRLEWVYGSDEDELPTAEVELHPDATRPDYTSEWPGYKGQGQAGTSAAATPTTGSSLAWSQQLLTGSMQTRMSDPVIANGQLYVAAGSTLQVRDAKTGEVVASAPLAAQVESTCRLVYADGLVVVPLHGGRLQALTADTLETVWLTDALPASTAADGNALAQQPISTLTVADGHVYFGTAAAAFSGDSVGGWLACVSLADGATTWQSENASCGYYWSGLASTDGGMLVADDAGEVSLLDPATGAVRSTLSLGASSRAGVTAGTDGSSAYAVTRDGVLHRLSVGEDGSLAETGSVSFADYSTSTPTLAGGLLYVGGRDAAGHGALAVIDARTLAVRHSVTTLGSGVALEAEVKSAPVVVAQAGGTYAYFTCNGPTGGLYVYRLGDGTATLLFEPDEAQRQRCISTVAVGSDGALYYTNDSGYLFKVAVGTTLPSQGGATGGGTTGGGGSQDRENRRGTGQGRARTGASPAAGLRLLQGRPSPATADAAAGAGAAGRVPTGGALGLLDGMGSTTVRWTEGTIVTSLGDEATATQASEAGRRRGLPVWPIVGMCLGAAALVVALLWRRRDEDEEA